MIRNAMILSLLVLFAGAPVASVANEALDELLFSEELTGEWSGSDPKPVLFLILRRERALEIAPMFEPLAN